jgi:hypothetical protein
MTMSARKGRPNKSLPTDQYHRQDCAIGRLANVRKSGGG